MARDRGFTLTETVLAMVMLAGAIYAASMAYSHAHRLAIQTSQDEIAWQTIASTENVLRATPYSRLFARTLWLNVPNLPGGNGHVLLRPLPPLKAVEAVFDVRWRTPSGERHVTHSAVLSGFLGQVSDADR